MSLTVSPNNWQIFWLSSRNDLPEQYQDKKDNIISKLKICKTVSLALMSLSIIFGLANLSVLSIASSTVFLFVFLDAALICNKAYRLMQTKKERKKEQETEHAEDKKGEVTTFFEDLGERAEEFYDKTKKIIKGEVKTAVAVITKEEKIVITDKEVLKPFLDIKKSSLFFMRAFSNKKLQGFLNPRIQNNNLQIFLKMN